MNDHVANPPCQVRSAVSLKQADRLSGEWKLVYTSNSELFALLALSKLPFVTVGDITQTIDGAAGTVVNKVRGPPVNCLPFAGVCVHSGLRS